MLHVSRLTVVCIAAAFGRTGTVRWSTGAASLTSCIPHSSELAAVPLKFTNVGLCRTAFRQCLGSNGVTCSGCGGLGETGTHPKPPCGEGARPPPSSSSCYCRRRRRRNRHGHLEPWSLPKNIHTVGRTTIRQVPWHALLGWRVWKWLCLLRGCVPSWLLWAAARLGGVQGPARVVVVGHVRCGRTCQIVLLQVRVHQFLLELAGLPAPYGRVIVDEAGQPQ